MREFTKLQNQVREYDGRYGWENDRSAHILLHMQEELGEISRWVMRHEGYKKEDFSAEKLGQEIVDLLYLTLKFASSFGIDLGKEWDSAWERYERKNSNAVKSSR